MNEYEAFGGNVLRTEHGNTGRKTCPGTTLSTRIPTRIGHKSNPALRGKRPGD